MHTQTHKQTHTHTCTHAHTHTHTHTHTAANARPPFNAAYITWSIATQVICFVYVCSRESQSADDNNTGVPTVMRGTQRPRGGLSLALALSLSLSLSLTHTLSLSLTHTHTHTHTHSSRVRYGVTSDFDCYPERFVLALSQTPRRPACPRNIPTFSLALPAMRCREETSITTSTPLHGRETGPTIRDGVRGLPACRCAGLCTFGGEQTIV